MLALATAPERCARRWNLRAARENRALMSDRNGKAVGRRHGAAMRVSLAANALARGNPPAALALVEAQPLQTETRQAPPSTGARNGNGRGVATAADALIYSTVDACLPLPQEGDGSEVKANERGQNGFAAVQDKATFEARFAEAERAAGKASGAVSVLAAELKHLRRAASMGDIPKMRKIAGQISSALSAVEEQVASAQDAWPLLPEAEEEYLRFSYAHELVEAAKGVGLRIQQRDNVLVAFPLIVRVLPYERAVGIDRKKIHTLRPSRLVRALKVIQTRRPRIAAELFLEILHRAYRLLVGRNYGTTVALSSIYHAFTLLPGVVSNYDHVDFARDLFLLDRSGLTHTKSGARVSLPASTGTKERKGTYRFVAPDGETTTYYGIRFTEEPL